MRSIDQLRARFGWHAESDENPDIEPLTLEAARNLRLPWLSRFSPQTLRAQIEVQPDYSLWVPATGEFIVGEPWRRRRDIGSIVEVSARKGKPALVRDLVTKMHSRGNRLVMLADDVWRDETRLYMRLGFEKIQTIVFF